MASSHIPILFALIIVISTLTTAEPLSSQVVPINTSDQLWHRLCSGNVSIQNNLVLNLTQKKYVLYNMTFCLIGNVSNITLTGLFDSNSLIKCLKKENSSSTTGFGFVNISSITKENLEFIECGATITKTAVTSFNDTHPHLGYKQKALLVFNHCYNITIHHVIIAHYIGYAILMFNPLGSSLMHHIKVQYGFGASQCTDFGMFACAGSGIAVIFKDTQRTSPNMTTVNIVMSHSTLYYNLNFIPDVPSLTLIGNEICKLPIIVSGGLTVLFNQSYVAKFKSQYTTAGYNGGTVTGYLLVLFYNGMMNSHFSLKNVDEYNGYIIPSTKQIGGACITIISILCHTCYLISINEWTPIAFNNVTFGTQTGGYLEELPYLKYGEDIYLNVFELCCAKSINIFLKGVKYRYHYAYISGSGLYAFVRDQVRNYKESNISIVLEDTEVFFSRKGHSGYTVYSIVPSMTLINWNNIFVSGNSNFQDTNSPTIAVYHSNLHIIGNVSFINNKAAIGAAIQLYNSFLILQEPLTATFINNSVLLYGGAIYIDNVVIPGHNTCPIQIKTNKTDLHNLNITLIFKGNTAGLAGNSIYATSFHNCFFPIQNDFKSPYFDWRSITHFDPPTSLENELKQISSQPVKICSCHHDPTKNESISKQCSTKHHIINTYPGKTIVISLCAIDDFGNIIYSPAIALFTNRNYFKQEMLLPDILYLKEGQTLVPLFGNKCNQINYNVLSKRNEFQYGVLNIATPGYRTSWLASIYVHPCPMGFMLTGGECGCNSFITDISPTTICNITTTTISISSGQWLGHIFSDNKSDLGFASVCPPGNCKTDTLLINVTDPLSICESSKAGILCGQCQHNLSVVFGSTECRPCSHLWLITIVAYALSGLLLVVIMLVLHLTISEGPLAGIIIAMNITSVSTIDYLDNNNWFIYTARVFVSLINLNLGFPMCLYNGMTTAVKTGIQFVYPVYLWILVIGFIIFSQHSSRISHKTARYSVQVLASLVHLSFSKVLASCIDIIAYVSVHTVQDRTVIVWYGDGNINYLSSPQHIALFTVAMTSLLLYVIPYIIFLTLGRYCMRWRYVNKYLRPFLEAFQGPYKQGQGYWYGVRMITVVYVHLMWAVFRGYNVNLMLFMQLTPVIILCFIQTSIKPFRNSILNHIDSFCIAMLIIQLLSAIAFGDRYYWLSYIIVSYNYIVVILFFGVIGYRCWEKCKCKLRKERNHDYGRVVIPSDEEDDEMRQAVIAFQD